MTVAGEGDCEERGSDDRSDDDRRRSHDSARRVRTHQVLVSDQPRRRGGDLRVRDRAARVPFGLPRGSLGIPARAVRRDGVRGARLAAYALAVDFFTVAIGELLLAVAMSLISGADSALLYETLLALREEATFPRWFGRYRAFGNIAEGTAALVGAYVFVRAPRAPFVIQIALCSVNLALSHAMCEPPRDRGQDLPAFERVRGLIRFVALGAPRLRAVVALLVALSLPSYVMVWVLPAYVADAGINAAFMGPIWAAASYTVALASWSSPRLAQRIGTTQALGLCVLLIATGYLGLGLSHATFGFLFYFALCTVRGSSCRCCIRRNSGWCLRATARRCSHSIVWYFERPSC